MQECLEQVESSKLERVAGVEPASLAWEARVIPIYDTRDIMFGGLLLPCGYK